MDRRLFTAPRSDRIVSIEIEKGKEKEIAEMRDRSCVLPVKATSSGSEFTEEVCELYGRRGVYAI